MNPGEARERLCQYIYRTLEPTNHLGLVQQAMELAIAAEPLEKKIRVEGVKTGRVTALDLPGRIRESLAAGIITDAEAAQLREYDRKVMDIIPARGASSACTVKIADLGAIRNRILRKKEEVDRNPGRV
jgi:acyl-CoA dehydrogenase